MSNGYSWQVVSQQNDQQFGTDGSVTTGKTVTFSIMPSGYTGTLFIPDVIYQNTDAVKEMIQNEVDQIMAVHQLTG